MKLGRAWPAVILALFCLPLFVDLGHADLFGDEAIYSWGADYILQTGEWLTPVSSPYPDRPFLEKPPLKFWVVAAGIKAGVFIFRCVETGNWDRLAPAPYRFTDRKIDDAALT